MLKNVLMIAAIIFLARPTLAVTRYVAQTAGTFSGGNHCNGQSAITPATWNSTAESPGDITYLCGPITEGNGSTILTISSSGSSGNPIQIIFDTGASLQAPYFSATQGAIYCSGQSYITIDGAGVGIIENTNNGSTTLGYSDNASEGIQFVSCPHAVIKNLTVRNIFIHQTEDNDTNGANTCGICVGDSDFVQITGNTVNNAYAGIGLGANTVASGGNVTSALIQGNTIDVTNHMMNFGADVANSSMSGVTIDRNTVGTDFNTWIRADGSYHQDGLIIGSTISGTPSTFSNFVLSNNTIKAGSCTSTGGNFTGYVFLTGGSFSNWTLFNNILAAAMTTNGCQLQALMWMDGSTLATSSFATFSWYNNVFDLLNVSNSSGASNAGIGYTGSSFTGGILENNVFQNFSVGGEAGILWEGGTLDSSFGTNIDHNLWYNDNEWAVEFTNNQHYTSWSQWQTAAASPNNFPGYDTHGSNSNPNFGSGYVPNSGSPLIVLGANLTSSCGSFSALCSDLNGNPRPATGTWTAGAYNYVATPSLLPAGIVIQGIMLQGAFLQ